jgi:hypothetical protein
MWQEILINAFCALCGLIALGVAAWALISGKIAEQGLDGLFLVLICLLIAFAFSIIPLHAVRKELLKRRASGKEPKAAKPDQQEAAPAVAGKSQGGN